MQQTGNTYNSKHQPTSGQNNIKSVESPSSASCCSSSFSGSSTPTLSLANNLCVGSGGINLISQNKKLLINNLICSKVASDFNTSNASQNHHYLNAAYNSMIMKKTAAAANGNANSQNLAAPSVGFVAPADKKSSNGDKFPNNLLNENKFQTNYYASLDHHPYHQFTTNQPTNESFTNYGLSMNDSDPMAHHHHHHHHHQHSSNSTTSINLNNGNTGASNSFINSGVVAGTNGTSNSNNYQYFTCLRNNLNDENDYGSCMDLASSANGFYLPVLT